MIALLLGCTVAIVPVWVAESRYRAEEADTAVRIDTEEPGRKYAFFGPMLNSQGFHDYEIPLEKTTAKRVVVLGDSLTYGAGLPVEQVWPKVAQAELQWRGDDWEFVNLAITGYDTEQCAATLRYRGWAYHPDLVVYAAYTNDHVPTDTLAVGQARNVVYVGTTVAPGLTRVPAPLVNWLLPRSAMVRRYVGAAATRQGWNLGLAEKNGDISFFTRYLDDMARQADEHGVPLIVFGLLPHVFASPDLATCNAQARRANFCDPELRTIQAYEEATTERGILFAGVLPYLQNTGRWSYYDAAGVDPVHPGPDGHALFGRAMADIVLRWSGGRRIHPSPYRRFLGPG